MSKGKLDIKKVRQLLDTYYNGESSAEQEALLRDFFRDTTDIPSDLKADAAMFRDFSYIEASPPTRATIQSKTPAYRRKTWRRIAAIASGLAAAAVVFAIIIPGNRTITPTLSQPKEPLHQNITANTSTSKDIKGEDNGSAKEQPEYSAETTEIAEKTTMIADCKSGARKSSTVEQTEDVDGNPYFEISDGEEAGRIVNDLLLDVAGKIDKAFAFVDKTSTEQQENLQGIWTQLE